MDSWEYKVADLTKVEKDIAELNRLGAEGWEWCRPGEPGASGSSTRSLCSSGR
jgi:hypothetical protein